MDNPKIAVSLQLYDWEAVLIAISRATADQHLSGGRACYEVGYMRLRYIAAVIRQRIKPKVVTP